MRRSTALLVLLTFFGAKASAASSFQPDFPGAVVYPSANFNDRKKDISVLIMHYTASATAQEALQILTEDNPDGVSAHYLVFENGTIYQLVQESKRAWHAGVGGWREITSDMNSASIGIEIQNTGDLYSNNFEPPFPQKQIDSVIALAKSIIARHKIIPIRLIGHQDHAPTRKPDPGHAFPWNQLFAAGLGVWVEPAPIVAGSSLSVGDNNQRVKQMQQDLATLGYEISVDGIFGSGTKACVIAFQKHWRQELFNGVADNSTLETLKRVVAALDNPNPTPAPGSCPGGWTPSATDRTKCYLYHKEDVGTVPESISFRCHIPTLSRHATISSPPQRLLAFKMGLKTEKFEVWLFQPDMALDLAVNVDPWIGLSRVGGDWTWADGKAVSYLNWDNGQPTSDGDCVFMLTSTGKWSVANCAISRPFLCELYFSAS